MRISPFKRFVRKGGAASECIDFLIAGDDCVRETQLIYFDLVKEKTTLCHLETECC